MTLAKRILKPTIVLAIFVSIFSIIFNYYDTTLAKQVTNNYQTTDNIEKQPDSVEWYQASSSYSINNLQKTKIPRDVKGLYVTGNTANNYRFGQIVNLLNETELNALVIDVKEDSGYITYKSNVPYVKEVNSDRKKYIDDIDALLKITKENNIYTIARIVTFKDPFYAASKTEIAMQKKTGGAWRDKSGVLWVDPFRKQVWEYNIAIAKEAAEKGFKEIQFDYVRFPENGRKVDREVSFDNPDNKSKAEVIASFLAYAKQQLKDYPVYISADVFGLTTSVADDMGIGQKWELLTPIVDYISPMMYPSHYANYTYGIRLPDADPYGTIKNGLIDALKKNEKVAKQGKDVAIIRPWLQDFTASYMPEYIKYGPNEVLAQIKAGKDLGVTQYLMWNAGNRYSENAWLNQ